MEITDKHLFFTAIILGVITIILRLIFGKLPPKEAKAQGTAAPAARAAEPRWYRWTRSFQETVEVFLSALVLALIIRAFAIQAFKIPSSSMEDTLLIGDHLLVNKFIYGVRNPFNNQVLIPVREPRRDEIFVFRFPLDPSRDFVKRCIGLPGDTIEIRDKQLYRNGQLVEQPYAVHKDMRLFSRKSKWATEDEKQRDNFKPFKVPEGQYFAMGDNRDLSNDSRFWGTVPAKELRGTPVLIYWPLDRIRLVK